MTQPWPLLPAGTDLPPLTPDQHTAQDWLQHELAKPEYQAAKPTWFDTVAQQIAHWFQSLALPTGDAGWIIAAIGVALLAAVVIGAVVVFGVPRIRRSAPASAVFDIDDGRSVDDLRRDAVTAARAARFDAAVLDLFRAIARSLAERTIVLVLPGTTAQEVAARAAAVLPDFASRLHEAAALFDGVRYLGRAAGAEDYAALAALDREVARTKPVLAQLHQPVGGEGLQR